MTSMNKLIFKINNVLNPYLEEGQGPHAETAPPGRNTGGDGP